LGFPNPFVIYGPNSPPPPAFHDHEGQADCVAGAIKHAIDRDAAIKPRAESESAYIEKCDEIEVHSRVSTARTFLVSL
jgi:hypothetical protein